MKFTEHNTCQASLYHIINWINTTSESLYRTTTYSCHIDELHTNEQMLCVPSWYIHCPCWSHTHVSCIRKPICCPCCSFFICLYRKLLCKFTNYTDELYINNEAWIHGFVYRNFILSVFMIPINTILPVLIVLFRWVACLWSQLQVIPIGVGIYSIPWFWHLRERVMELINTSNIIFVKRNGHNFLHIDFLSLIDYAIAKSIYWMI